MLDESLRQTIQDRATEIIGTFVDLKRQGKSLLGRCPFHHDTHPSLSVSPEKRVFHCFGCGAGGDVFAFLMRLKGLTFPEAVEEATRALGLPAPSRLQPAATAKLAATTEYATQLFEHWLWQPEGAPGRAYLRQRGITVETAKTFRLGFHPDQPTLLVRALAARGVTRANAETLGLVTRKGDRSTGCMRGRLIFPIADGQGQVRGFGSRRITKRGPKYLNSPDSPRFHKGQLLYGLPQARPAIRERGAALIVEGYLDVLMLHQAGCPHVVSPLSTTLSVSQLRTVRPLAPRVILVFDGDTAGQEAVMRLFLPAEESGVQIEVVVLPSGEDPDSYVRTHGRAALDTCLASAQRLDAYVLDQLVTQHPSGQAAQKIVELSVQLTHPLAQLAFLQHAEGKLRLPAGSLTEAAGIGHAARQQLEELLCGLVLTMPEVRERVRGVLLPLRNPHLRVLAAHALRNEPIRGDRAKEAARLATMVARRSRDENGQRCISTHADALSSGGMRYE